MTEIITYALRNGEKRSDTYYRDIAAFAIEVLDAINEQAKQFIEAYQGYIRQNQIEEVRRFDEYALELLLLGTLWCAHGNQAIQLTKISQRILSSLGKLRNQYEVLKEFFDVWRGVLGPALLTAKNSHSKIAPELTLENFSRLLDWMSATGELGEEVKRLSQWQDYLKKLNPAEAVEILKAATNLTSWFESRSIEILGQYTENVESFLTHQHPKYRWREDNFFCGRERIEYHFNMVGTEILNRSFRDDFLKTDRKIVLLPPCMKAKLERGCRAVETPQGERCMACTPGCRVHQLTKLGEKYGFMVLVMPHDMKVFSENDESTQKPRSTGIIGVSCPLTNTAGGWEMKSVGVPAQGVLLDYCGCPWHWHEDGIATDINFNQVLHVLGIQQPARK